ncbi:hypothetical protein L7F22_065224 [Adiantum nelumboides]|nr:hypothetical protein [Adiantum nelumboides]
MDGNEWINGYLEAILDAGAVIAKHRHQQSRSSSTSSPSPAHGAALPASSNNSFVSPASLQSELLPGHGNINPTKFFVEEVTSGFDEADLYKTWMKSIAMRSAQTRNNRMENLCWRIWHLTRKKKQIAWEDAQRLARRHYEREQGHKAASKELSELSDGEKPDRNSKSKTGPNISRIHSNFEIFVQQQQPHKKKSLYIVLISIHGLVRGYNMELGRDSDTGGQVKYVVELARALAMMQEVYRVDLLTRQICSPDVDWSYWEPTEMLTHEDTEDAGEGSGAYIVRIPCGPRDQYVAKERLWPYVQEFVDGALAHVLSMSRALGEQVHGGERHVWPHVIHGHYADAGNIACLLAGALNVPMVLTGHSLGRNKLEQLLKQGCDTKEVINSTYRIMRRIEGEELSLDGAEIVITSTRQEIEEQWGLYDGFDVKLERVLRARAKEGMSCYGRYMPRMVVIPPGMDFSNVISPEVEDGDADVGPLSEPISPKPEPTIWGEIKRFFSNPHKPIILALARPDPKKNLTTLVKAFGECRPLRELANMVLIMGNRDDIDGMSGGNASVLTTILKLIDKYNLYGLVAYPKHHKQSDVPSIYRLTARTKGVFINPALVEPFGLTLIEAAAHGIPTVATKNGGPVDIYKALNNGLLVDPHNQKEIADALLKLVSDRNMWNECRKNGLANINFYSWPQHCRVYLARIAQCRMQHRHWQDGSLLDRQQAVDEDFSRDSLKDVHTHLSIDERSVGNGLDFFEHQSKLQSVQDYSNGSNLVHADGKGFWQRKMKKVIIVAIDSYDTCGKPDRKMLEAIQEIIKHVKAESPIHGPGFILSTAMRLSEMLELLNLGGLHLFEFDALICGSGSEIYYPDVYADHASTGLSKSQFCIDQDYAMHIDHRWGREGVRKTMARFLVSDVDNVLGTQRPLPMEEDEACANEHCLAYKVKDPSQGLRVEELRKNLRMRGLRCRVMYCKNESHLYIMPLFASRAQALRYLFVRWGTDISNMILFVGEAGDNDYEELLSGAHKTIILKGFVEGSGSDRLLRGSGSYHKEDMVPTESPNIITADLSGLSQALQNAMQR